MDKQREDPLEKKVVTHSSILDWEIPWTEEPDGNWTVITHSQLYMDSMGKILVDTKLSAYIYYTVYYISLLSLWTNQNIIIEMFIFIWKGSCIWLKYYQPHTWLCYNYINADKQCINPLNDHLKSKSWLNNYLEDSKEIIICLSCL